MRNLQFLRSVRRWGWRLADPTKPPPRIFAPKPDANQSASRAVASPRKAGNQVWIQVGLGPRGRRFGLVTPAHLQAFGIEPEFYEPLYDVWFQFLAVIEENGGPIPLEAQAGTMHAALQISESPIGYDDCYRWALLMNTAFLLSLIPPKGDQR